MTQSSETYKDDDVFIVSAVRTPIGKYGGKLSSFTAPQLGSFVIKEALSRCNISPNNVNEVYFGNVLQANIGQAPARQASLLSGIPNTVPCTTINKVCSSGMKTIQLASNSLKLNQNNNNIIVCGGMESMSNVPYYINSNDIRLNNNNKNKMGNMKLIDGMIYDGLWDIYTNQHMGNCGEICSNKYNITRKQQDDYSILSYKRAQFANKNGIFNNEIIPINIINPKTKQIKEIMNKDEGCQNFDESKLRKLRPAFKRDKSGTVTAGNASQLSDGAAALIVVSGRYLNNLNKSNKFKCIPLVKIISYSDASQEPTEFTTTPSIAIPLALKNGNLKLSDLNKNDYFEINEAFSVVSLVNAKLLNISINKLNINGGAVALGHPLGCSGARIIVTLINILKQNNGRYGIAGICNGGGGASAMVIKNM